MPQRKNNDPDALKNAIKTLMEMPSSVPDNMLRFRYKGLAIAPHPLTYSLSGIPNIVLQNGFECSVDGTTIFNINQLHFVIAKRLIAHLPKEHQRFITSLIDIGSGKTNWQAVN